MHLIFSDDSYYKYSCRNIPPIGSKTWGWLKNHSEKATPSSSREALGCSCCRVNACNHISKTTATALSPVNVDVVMSQEKPPNSGDRPQENNCSCSLLYYGSGLLLLQNERSALESRGKMSSKCLQSPLVSRQLQPPPLKFCIPAAEWAHSATS